MVGQIIQFILAPVVMITSCALVLNGLLARYAAINDRLRLMAHERLELLRAAYADDPFVVERVAEIDRQLPDLLRRHRQTHDAVLLVYCAVLLFIASMFVIAVLVISGAAWVSSLVLVLFLGAILALMGGVALAVIEIFGSHRAVHYEVRHIAGLPGGAAPSN